MKLGLREVAIGIGVVGLLLDGKKAQASGGQWQIPKGDVPMTLDQLRELARAVGFPDPDLAAAIAMAESAGFEHAVGDKGNSFGLWQINRPAHPKYEPALLLTQWYNAQAALDISKKGTDWVPWSTYSYDRKGKFVGHGKGFYTEFLPVAVVKQIAPAAEPLAGELEEPEDTEVVNAPPSELVDEPSKPG